MPQIIKLEVPTGIWQADQQKAVAAIRNATRPDFVLCIGQAGGRSQLTPEFVGINYAQARIPDNEGNQPLNEPLVAWRAGQRISRSCRSTPWWRR